ncbi:WD40 repeat-like protein [Tilletiaria anomala UBC 951]|uniref:WD40 repeat-like protein n=1 Tax=Tilletiaria anomala (strain ATCC 24038 / CBS 436.72 / UBC 951) TaxID=1037660 RepID=A0A066W2K1_TILAU|nr:WD40 repeat-like protein [Tilletiaria anomala UBC 951]KDN45299.1 WD40 repeat-like protein [Tilletiaria anomala UBC 951]
MAGPGPGGPGQGAAPGSGPGGPGPGPGGAGSGGPPPPPSHPMNPAATAAAAHHHQAQAQAAQQQQQQHQQQQHAGMQPQHPAHAAAAAAAAHQAQAQAAVAASSARLADLLEFVKHEFDLLGNDAAQLKGQRDEFEHMISNQVGEVQRMQQHIVELEKRHSAMAGQYEEEIKRLRNMLDVRASSVGPPPHMGPPGTARIDSSAEMRERERDGGAPHLPLSFDRRAAASAAEEERMNGYEREQGERDRDRDGRPFGGPEKRMRIERERDREWDRDSLRDREVRERELTSGSTGKGNGRSGGAGSPIPSSNHSASGKDSARYGAVSAASPRGLPLMHGRHASPGRERGSMLPTGGEQAAAAVVAGNASLANLSDLDPDEVPKDLKKEGSDWLAIFNPKVKRVLDVNLVHTLMHESVVCCVRFSPDGKYLATGCNKSAQIYDTKTGAKSCVLSEQPPNSKGDLYIRSVCFSPDGKYLATGAEDRQIRIWNIATKKVKHLLQGHKQEIYSLDWSRDGRIIASGSGDKTVRIWDVDSGELMHTLYTSPGMEHGPSEAGVTSVSISSDSRLVAAGALDTLVRVWDAKTGRQLERLKSHKDSIYSVSFAPDGKSLVSGSLDKTLKMWDLTDTYHALNEGRYPPDTGRDDDRLGNASCAVTFLGHKDYVLSVSCSPDGQWVASGSKDRGVQFWDPKTAETQCVLQGHKNSVIAINLSPAGGLLATGSGDFK